MKVGLISVTKSDNYGACLQAWSLYYTLEKLGCECEYIDYKKGYLKSVIIWFFRKLISAVFGKDDYPSYSLKEFFEAVYERKRDAEKSPTEREKLFEEFWGLCDYSDPVRRNGLSIIEKNYDIFIAGSDQIWNCGYLNLDTTYLLDFVTGDNCRRNSYASSVALEHIPSKYAGKYSALLGRFNEISLRESSHVKIELEEMLHRKIEIMPDPVMLTTQEEWIEMSRPVSVSMPDSYILVYDILTDSEYLTAITRELSSKLKISVRRVYGCKGVENENIDSAIGPREWLYLVNNADVVVTNSFHATLFSIIFETDFLYVLSDNIHTRMTSSRITELLDNFSLKDHLIFEGQDEDEIESAIERIANHYNDLAKNRLIISGQRKKGIDFLKNCIND